jgi:hypothetical protein
MAKTYTTTINIKCWKEHTCVSCGAVHSYPFKRKVTGRAGNAAASQRQAQAAVEKTLKTQVDLHPCPACGILQPDMIGQQRVRWHKTTFWLALLAFITLLILRGMDILQANTATWMIVAVGALAALQTFGKELKNFNADPEANRMVAAEQITAGKLQHAAGEPASAAAEWIQIPRSFAQSFAAPLLFAGVLLLAAAELLRVARGWPLNPAAYPPVVGPGDQTRIYMPHKIDSINGYWRGTPKAVLSEPGTEQAVVSLEATANQNDWGDTISADSNAEHNSSTPWVVIHLPQDPSLSRKTVDCDIQLDIQYPHKTEGNDFDTDSDSMEQQLKLHLATSGAGGLYDQLWWGGGVAGIVVVLGTTLGLIVSARRLQAKANPTRILNPATPA